MAMAQKLLNGRFKVKRDTTANWNAAVGFVPLDGEIIVYTDYKTVTENNVTKNVPGIKIGSGNAYVQDLAFLGDAEAETLFSHIGNTVVHTSAAEKAFWDRKLNFNDASEVVDETLIFNRY